MNVSPQIVDLVKYKAWDNSIMSSGKYSLYHSSAWAEVLLETYDYQPVHFILTEKKEHLCYLNDRKFNLNVQILAYHQEYHDSREQTTIASIVKSRLAPGLADLKKI